MTVENFFAQLVKYDFLYSKKSAKVRGFQIWTPHICICLGLVSICKIHRKYSFFHNSAVPWLKNG
jgi:hypothetical protein